MNEIAHYPNDVAAHITSTDISCKTQIDILTHEMVYTTADTAPKNKGGLAEISKCFLEIQIDSVPPDLDTRFIIKFIVETDGTIKGERIIKDKTGQVGGALIKMAKSFIWEPATCNGKKVPMLHTITIQACIAEK